MQNLTITITKSDLNPGYAYDIYDCEPFELVDGPDPIDGGLCTTTMANVLEMAYLQAKQILQARKK